MKLMEYLVENSDKIMGFLGVVFLLVVSNAVTYTISHNKAFNEGKASVNCNVTSDVFYEEKANSVSLGYNHTDCSVHQSDTLTRISFNDFNALDKTFECDLYDGKIEMIIGDMSCLEANWDDATQSLPKGSNCYETLTATVTERRVW